MRYGEILNRIIFVLQSDIAKRIFPLFSDKNDEVYFVVFEPRPREGNELESGDELNTKAISRAPEDSGTYSLLCR